jgi:hypothetical protein
MKDTTYNGWTNYETWRVNLEIFDGFDPVEYFGLTAKYHPADLGDILKDYATEILESEGTKGLTFDYAMAFLDAVNWREIAKQMLINKYIEEDLPIPEDIYMVSN